MGRDHDDDSNPPLSFGEDIEDPKVIGSGVLAADEDSEVGILTLLTLPGDSTKLTDT
jgi:hypothetical protein